MESSTVTTAPKAPIMVTTTLEVAVEVPREDWINYLTQYPDIFGQGYCGYWLRGVERDKALGQLAWEDDEDHARGEEPNREEAVRAWRAGETLPEGWFRLDEAAAVKAYHEGMKLWGADWFESKGDANTYDVAIQMALLGEIRYG